jgi:hypothetical protein
VKAFSQVSMMALLLSGSIATARAETTHVDIAGTGLATHTSTDTSKGRYYTLVLTLPPSIRGVRQAWLEFRADVSVAEIDGFLDPVPVFQVFMLKQALLGEPTEASFETMRLPMSRPVAVGLDRRVRIDITEYVSKTLARPSMNHGLVLGSVTGDRRADFQIKSDTFGAGIPARLTLVE